jgi:hypothetical protein
MRGAKILFWGVRNSILFSAFFGLITLNVLTLTSSVVHDVLFSTLSNVVPTKWSENSPTKRYAKVSQKNQSLLTKNKALSESANVKANKAKNVVSKITKRTIRNVSVNATSVVGEVVPFAGAAIVVGVTLMDIHDGCETMKDMDEMMATFGIDNDEGGSDKVCGLSIPSKEEIMLSMRKGAKSNWDKSVDAIGGTLSEIIN